ncbi:Serine/threonine protein kinase [hydrothermal vent metagenome]|uniref:Serine/threonine protein kinase n=1 Tax=hydrothermal vent metagenome TaxID=652676 RepID=A0A3B1B3N3_9ZZZZ
MNAKLNVTIGQHSEQGLKSENQDFHGAIIPESPQLDTKGIAIAIADGVSSSIDGREASQTAVGSFLSDYYSTPDSWTAKTSAHKILTAINSWLYSKAQHTEHATRGLLTTFSALVLKSTTGHIFHVGDSRVYRLQKHNMEQLTTDHRRWVSEEKNYLNRAVGIDIHLDIDYRKLTLKPGDIFILTTDGVHDFVNNNDIQRIVEENHDLQAAAEKLVKFALDGGSNDNITAQIVRVDSLPMKDTNTALKELTQLPFPPPLDPGMVLDGYRILKEIHASKRTQVYKAEDSETGQTVIIKTPSVNYDDDPAYIEGFVREEWAGKRINNSRVLKIIDQKRKRTFRYYIMEYIDGQTLREWMNQHSRPDIKEVRLLVEQITTGLRAFHRLEMLHQDLKPENIMLDANGTAKIIDFGSTKIAGIAEISSPIERIEMLGTKNYTAPEYLLGQPGSNRSDIFSLGTITYELLTGKLPYGDALDRTEGRSAVAKLKYQPSYHHNPMIPVWMDRAIKKAVHPEAKQRYDILSEFIHDLSHPNPNFMDDASVPLLERNPIAFWRGLSIALAIGNGVLLYLLLR